MEFDKSKVFTALNADEVKLGSKGYYADNLNTLKERVGNNDQSYYGVITDITDARKTYRFQTGKICYNLFYLVEEPQEKKFRPYKDTDEMIEDFKRRYSSYGGWSGKGNPMYNPMIWVKAKGVEKNKYLITGFQENERVTMNFDNDIFTTGFCTLFDKFTYLDGSPCGIMEE